MQEHDLDRDPPSADLLAAEYVLGVLDTPQRREARMRINRDPAFARLVDDWARRLEPMNDELAAEPAPAHVWPRVRTRLGWSPVGGQDRATGGTGFWKGATAAGFAAAAALAIVALQKPRVVVQPPPRVAVQPAASAMPEVPVTRLVANNGQIAYLATVDRNGGGIWMVPVPGTVPLGQKAPVLWLIPPGQKPKSLGYVGASRSHWVDVPKSQLQAGWTVAITMEPVQPVAPEAPSSAPMAAGEITL